MSKRTAKQLSERTVLLIEESKAGSDVLHPASNSAVTSDAVVMPSYSHRDFQGRWHSYSDEECRIIEEAERFAQPAVNLPPVLGNDGIVRHFQVQFEANARSSQSHEASSTGMIQVNLATRVTRPVRRDNGTGFQPSQDLGVSSRPSGNGSACARGSIFNDYASDSEPLYGWLLRKQSKGWRKGSWQRRFFVLAPRSSALLYFAKGLHSRHVALCREASHDAPQAKGTIPLRGARIDQTLVEDDKPFSFSIRVPGAEYQLSARAEGLKQKWLAQLHAVARGEPLGRVEVPSVRLDAQSVHDSQPSQTLPSIALQAPAQTNLPLQASPQPDILFARPTAPPEFPSISDQENKSQGTDTPLCYLEPTQNQPNGYSYSPQVNGSATLLPTGADAPEAQKPTVINSGVPEGTHPSVPPAGSFTVQPQMTENSQCAPEYMVEPAATECQQCEPEYKEASPEKLTGDDDLGAFFTSLVLTGGEAAEEHSECAVCFDELHARPVGVLMAAGGRRLCRHIVHLDCLCDLPGQPAPLCPMCRRASVGVQTLPSVIDDPWTWFTLLDLDGIGRIEAEVVLSTLKAQLALKEGELDANWDKIWDLVDLDHSGSMTYDELVEPQRGLLAVVKRVLGAEATEATPGSSTTPPDRHANAPDLTRDKTGWFEYWDDDGSNSLDEGELVRALVHSFNKAGRRDEVRAITEIVSALLATCDVEGDGLISREEFLAPDVGLADVIVSNFGFFNSQSANHNNDADGTHAPPPLPPRAPPMSRPAPGQSDWAVEIRTNGGSRYSTASLNEKIGPHSTVGQLRAAAAKLHNDMRPERVRLVNRGAQLRVDHITLATAGVRNGDSIMLVVGSSSQPNTTASTPPMPDLAPSALPQSAPPAFANANRPPANPFNNTQPIRTAMSMRPNQSQAPPPLRQTLSYQDVPSQQRSQCRVTVPANVGPGTPLTFRAPTGETLRVVVPPGFPSGSSFVVQYGQNSSSATGTNPARYSMPPTSSTRPMPLPDSHRLTPSSTNHQSLGSQPTADSNNYFNMRVKVPPGAIPGNTLTVNVPQVGHCRVVVPPGVVEGQYFEFRVAARR